LSIDAHISRPSSGLSKYLQVHRQTIVHMLSDIKDANNRSDDELIFILQKAAQAAFQVWSYTLRWKETPTSSFSSLSESDPSSSEQQTSAGELGLLNSLRDVSSISTNIERDIAQNNTDTANASLLVHTGSTATPNNTPQSTYAIHSISPTSHNAMGISGGFELVANTHGLHTELNTFSQNGYNTNLIQMNDATWSNSLQDMQFSNSTAGYDSIHAPSGRTHNPFNVEGVPTHAMPNLNGPRWGDQYTDRGFGHYGREH